MNINNKLRYFKSAVAFFFLFFLHGTSIENGQQGISYNGIKLKADRLYKRLVCGGLILGCVSCSLFYLKLKKEWNV